MAQNREPPCFQEYAASMIAKVEYRVMSLAARGLLYSLRLECWINHGVPENPAQLAKLLGFAKEEVEAALPEVWSFFTVEGGKIICPELEDYRQHLAGIRRKQAEGGKRGAAVSNKNRNGISNKEKNETSGMPVGESQVTRNSVVKLRTAKQSQTQSLEKPIVPGDDDDACPAYKEWMNESSELLNAYEMASNGS